MGPDQSGRMRKISPSPGFHPQTIHPIRSHYTVYAMQAHIVYIAVFFNCMFLYKPMLFSSLTTLKFFKFHICVNTKGGSTQDLKRSCAI